MKVATDQVSHFFGSLNDFLLNSYFVPSPRKTAGPNQLKYPRSQKGLDRTQGMHAPVQGFQISIDPNNRGIGLGVEKRLVSAVGTYPHSKTSLRVAFLDLDTKESDWDVLIPGL